MLGFEESDEKIQYIFFEIWAVAGEIEPFVLEIEPLLVFPRWQFSKKSSEMNATERDVNPQKKQLLTPNSRKVTASRSLGKNRLRRQKKAAEVRERFHLELSWWLLCLN